MASAPLHQQPTPAGSRKRRGRGGAPWFELRVYDVRLVVYRAGDRHGVAIKANRYGDRLIGYGLVVGVLVISFVWRRA